MKTLLTFFLLSVAIDSFFAQVLCHGKKVILIDDGDCSKNNFVLTFEDNFDGNTLDTTKWRVKTGVVRDPNQDNAIQWFLPQNAIVSNGTLKLVVKRDTFLNKCFSLWINSTLGVQHYCHDFYFSGAEIACREDFLHGRYDIRCKIPKAKGMFSAFWIWGFDHHNEIDVFEFTNEDNLFGKYKSEKSARVHAMNMHMDIENNGNVKHCPMKYEGADFSNDFHTFSVIWTPHMIQWLVDEKIVRTSTLFYTISGQQVGCEGLFKWNEYVQNKIFPRYPMHAIASMCVQAGKSQPDDETPFPNEFEIDFIRFYRLE